MSDRLRFGAFVPPHHLPVNYNPTYALQRNVELVQMLDTIGFDEAWFGEHHSGGAEPIGDPMLFIAHVAAQTRYIRLGTGVVSLPYHNPLSAWFSPPPQAGWTSDRVWPKQFVLSWAGSMNSIISLTCSFSMMNAKA